MPPLKPLTLNRISSEAVQKATGKTWEEWLDLLDRENAVTMPHAQIAKFLGERFKVEPWWRQMITVGYEQARGMRFKHEKKDGFEISVSRTFDVPGAALFTAFLDPARRASWCHERSYNVRSSNRPSSLRIEWTDGSSVVVAITRKGNSRAAVTVQHGKLANAEKAAEAKRQWTESLDRLRAMLG
jgi:uncharacterized protein YndB with AHSA1/START domain